MYACCMVPKGLPFNVLCAYTDGRAGDELKHTCAGSPASTVKLGGSDLEVSRLGIGTIRWGDTSKGFGSSFDAVSTCVVDRLLQA